MADQETEYGMVVGSPRHTQTVERLKMLSEVFERLGEDVDNQACIMEAVRKTANFGSQALKIDEQSSSPPVATEFVFERVQCLTGEDEQGTDCREAVQKCVPGLEGNIRALQ